MVPETALVTETGSIITNLPPRTQTNTENIDTPLAIKRKTDRSNPKESSNPLLTQILGKLGRQSL